MDMICVRCLRDVDECMENVTSFAFLEVNGQPVCEDCLTESDVEKLANIANDLR